MQDEYFGRKELYEVVLKAKNPMRFGARELEAAEPVLYFEKVQMAVLTEQNRPIFARGGWGNLPQVIWEDRSEVQFSLTEGVMNTAGTGILFSAHVTTEKEEPPLIVPKREGPKTLNENSRIYLEHWPVPVEKRKAFIYEYARNAIQKKVYGKRITGITNPFDSAHDKPCIEVYNDKDLQDLANPDLDKEYIIDYYYEYGGEALIYTVQKERFNGLFTLEGKFYSKDENDGIDYTNVIYMPKVRVMSDINLRLGERADPTVSNFNIIGLPETQSGNKQGLIMEITHLDSNIDIEKEL